TDQKLLSSAADSADFPPQRLWVERTATSFLLTEKITTLFNRFFTRSRPPCFRRVRSHRRFAVFFINTKISRSSWARLMPSNVTRKRFGSKPAFEFLTII